MKSILSKLRRRNVSPNLSSAFFKWISPADVKRLQEMPRHVATTVLFKGKDIRIIDAGTFLVGLKEIFLEEPYRFLSESEFPLILDCGANIGLSTIFLKLRMPQSRIIAMEADPNICEVLKYNLNLFGYNDIEVVNEAVSTENGSVCFDNRGGFAGRISAAGDKGIQVASKRLKDRLSEKIDFLKIDIEGAEVDVLLDCEPGLHNVNHLFVEYHSPVEEEQRLDELLRVLSRAGFRYQLKTSFSSQKPFIERKSMGGMDFQIDIFALRGDALK